MWLLKSDGTLHEEAGLAPTLELHADVPFESVPTARSVMIIFASVADGRGFSLARQLRARGYNGMLVASGPLIPDQARHAFQSGFDAIAIAAASINRHTEAAWRDALSVSVRELYLPDGTSRGHERGIWALRHLS